MVKFISLWRIRAQDEGVRSLCEYLIQNPGVQTLDLMDNDITFLGCNFISKIYKSIPQELQITKVKNIIFQIQYQFLVLLSFI